MSNRGGGTVDTWQFSKKKIFPCHPSFYMKGSLQQGPVAAEMWWNAVIGLAQWSLPWIVSAAVSCEMLSPCQIRNNFAPFMGQSGSRRLERKDLGPVSWLEKLCLEECL